MMAKSKVWKLCLLCSLVSALLASGLAVYVFYRIGPIAKIYGIVNLLDTVFYRPVDREELVEGAYRGVVSSLGDPYSLYMTKISGKSFEFAHQGSIRA